MSAPIIIKLDGVDSQPVPGESNEKAGIIKRIIYPPRVKTKGTFFAYGEANPGHSPHRWHDHLGDTAEGYKVSYPEDFEEVYYIISGQGVMQWEGQDGRMREEPVGPGDTIFMPVGVPKHQLFNNADEKIVLVACGCPTPKVTLTE